MMIKTLARRGAETELRGDDRKSSECRREKMKIARESWIIAAIGLTDLVSTILFIEHHGASEANPLFHRLWEIGPLVFVAAKLACLIGPIAIFEWARRRRPQLVLLASRSVIAAYLLCYCVGFAGLNKPEPNGEETEAPIQVRIVRDELSEVHSNPQRMSPERWRAYVTKWRQAIDHATPAERPLLYSKLDRNITE